MQQVHHAGIDVSAQTLEVALVCPGRPLQQGTFANTPQGHRALLRWLTQGGRRVHVGVEATGLYSQPVAWALHRHRRIEVMVINPKAIKHYAHAHLQRAKTDPLDARLIADYIQRMPFQPWQPPDESSLHLQALTRRIGQLKRDLIAERCRLHAEAYRATPTDPIARDMQVHIRHLQRRIDRLDEQAQAVVETTPSLQTAYQRLRSIPGIGPTSAVRLLAELAPLPTDMKPPQWVAYAGLDPRPRQSGTSIDAPRPISKVGNKHLRTALYMPALVAVRHDGHIQAFYDQRIATGQKPKQALVAVMRKLLHTIWGVWTHDQDFDGEKFYRNAA